MMSLSSNSSSPSIAVEMTAPAKVNLNLHVTGRRDDGYHLLQSLVAFTNFGDKVEIYPADSYALDITGPFAASFLDGAAVQDNLITRAVMALGDMFGQTTGVSIRLVKNIPLGAGLGGGSADAAAVIRGMLQFWSGQGIEMPVVDMTALAPLLLSLGADVPVCYHGRDCFFEGIGDDIHPLVTAIPKMDILLVYPQKICSTPAVFKGFDTAFITQDIRRDGFDDRPDFLSYLQETQNSLSAPAISQIPEIARILQLLEQQQGCSLSRMSGSGSCCFGLFDDTALCQQGADAIRRAHPEWWVQTSYIGG